jgi:hypothetical protein
MHVLAQPCLNLSVQVRTSLEVSTHKPRDVTLEVYILLGYKKTVLKIKPWLLKDQTLDLLSKMSSLPPSSQLDSC